MLRTSLLWCLILLGSYSAQASDLTLPDAWLGETQDSAITINYDDLDYVLNAAVLMSGPPSRKKSKASSSTVSTRLKNNFNTLTTNAGNRLFFEEFKKNPEMAAVISKIRTSLEAVPAEVPLNQLSKKEQIAFWLNLYNVVVIDEINKVYPLKSLEEFITAKDGVLSKKLINIGGMQLSLNDIQYGVLQQKYPNEVLVIYGLYQGYIGSPSIRKYAYTGANLNRSLQFNANDFINTNRGTYPDGKTFRVAGFYQRNASYFPDFETDLRSHLREYLREDEIPLLDEAQTLVADIDDWTVTDIYGTSRNYGGGAATNDAALLGAFSQGGTMLGSEEVTNLELMANAVQAKSVTYGRFSADQVQKLKELKLNHENRGGVVTVTDLTEAEAKAAKEKTESGQQNDNPGQ
ncbi:MAG: DUF547 domain-containing protein [Chromatiaceae bacterium]